MILSTISCTNSRLIPDSPTAWPARVSKSRTASRNQEPVSWVMLISEWADIAMKGGSKKVPTSMEGTVAIAVAIAVR